MDTLPPTRPHLHQTVPPPENQAVYEPKRPILIQTTTMSKHQNVLQHLNVSNSSSVKYRDQHH